MDDKPIEGNLDGGGDSNANSNSSQRQGQPLEANLSAEIAKLQRKIDAQDGEIRALKSGKDKAVDRVVKSQEETLAKLAKYLNVDEKQLQEAQRQSVLDDLISERLGSSPSANAIQGRVAEQDNVTGSRTVDNFSAADAIAEVESYELSANDSSFVDLLRKNPNRQQVKDYILERKKPPKTANPADVVQAPARSAATERSPEGLISDYKKEMQAAPRGPKGDEQRRAIKNKYIQAGANIHNVDFTS